MACVFFPSTTAYIPISTVLFSVLLSNKRDSVSFLSSFMFVCATPETANTTERTIVYITFFILDFYLKIRLSPTGILYQSISLINLGKGQRQQEIFFVPPIRSDVLPLFSHRTGYRISIFLPCLLYNQTRQGFGKQIRTFPAYKVKIANLLITEFQRSFAQYGFEIGRAHV